MYTNCVTVMFASSLVLAGTTLGACQSSEPTVAHTESGTVRGAVKDGIIAWKGIPYAAPPVGALRWRAPQPAHHWKDEVAAKHFGPACPQTEDVVQAEDCLTLNVWRPATDSGPLPVMVWIHGGSLAKGSGALYPLDGLAKKGVVVMSMNYRLGRLGFFAHPALAAESPHEPMGNYGYLDQLAALKWVRKNIGAFGGDQRRVTIIGESAGGGSVLAHLVSPLSRGLYRAAILQSPGVPSARAGVTPLTPLADALRAGEAYGHTLGIDGEGEEALKALRAIRVSTLITGVSSGAVQQGQSSATPQLAGFTGSIIDGRFLAELPEAALSAGHQARVPILLGANDRDLAIGDAVDMRSLTKLLGADAPRAMQLYDSMGVQSFVELKQAVFSDRTMLEPTRHLADLWWRVGQPVYLYRFAYVREAERSTALGAKHGFEIPFVINHPTSLLTEGKVTPDDDAMADLMSNYWTQFAKTSDPNGKRWPIWPRHDPTADRLMHFTNGGALVAKDPLKARLDLWDFIWHRGH